MSTWTTPSAGPSTAPALPDIVFDNVKENTARELQKLKNALAVNDTDPNHTAEFQKIKEAFEAQKDTILKISGAELAELRAEIVDPNNTLPGKVDVVDGALVYNAETTPETTNAPAETIPETTRPEEPSLAPITASLPPNMQEEIANYQPDIKNSMGNWIRDAIINFIGGIFPEWAARMRGFTNANIEKRAENAYNTLTGDEWRNILWNSPLLNILVLDHIDKNEFKKILAQYPNLDFSNKRNIEAAFLGKHAGDQNLIKYHRIYEGMRKMCDELGRPEGISYNPKERLKQILSYSKDESIAVEYPDNTNTQPQIETFIEPIDPSSPEAQKVLLTQAKDLDTALSKAKAMPEGTDEEKNKKQEAVKNAEEALKKFQEERKNSIVNIYTDTQKKIQDTQTTIATLEARLSPDESERKQLDDANKELWRLQKIEGKIRTQIDTVMTEKDEKWEINTDTSAEKITKAEIAISAIESNTATIENQNLSEEEKKQKEQEKTKKLEEVTEAKTKLKDNNQIIDQKTTARDASIEKYKLDSQESIEWAKKILEKYQNDTEITSSEEYKKLRENIKFAEAKRELIKAAIESIGTKTLDWENDAYKTTESWYDFDSDWVHDDYQDLDNTDDDDDGWVEIENGKIRFDENWDTDEIELKYDPKIIDALKWNNQSGIWIARNIIIENKDIIKNRSMPE